MKNKHSSEAVGAWEAACLLGVHWSRPAKMAATGIITSRAIGGAESSNGRVFAVYSRDECDRNFDEYLDTKGLYGRPRTLEANRDMMIRLLDDPKRPRIQYGDAIGVYDAARILGVYWSYITRLVRAGKIIGRIAESGRSGGSRLWIISHRSCEEHLAKIRQLEASGKKTGRPRCGSVDE